MEENLYSLKIYDSLNKSKVISHYQEVFDIMKEFFNYYAKNDQEIFYELDIPDKVPQQQNPNDCGVFLMLTMKCVASNNPLRHKQVDIQRERLNIMLKLYELRANE